MRRDPCIPSMIHTKEGTREGRTSSPTYCFDISPLIARTATSKRVAPKSFSAFPDLVSTKSPLLSSLSPSKGFPPGGPELSAARTRTLRTCCAGSVDLRALPHPALPSAAVKPRAAGARVGIGRAGGAAWTTVREAALPGTACQNVSKSDG